MYASFKTTLNHLNKIKQLFQLFSNIYYYMGRKLIYKTKEEKRTAKNATYMRFYEKNKERIKKEKLERYYENKRNIQDNK
jgi:hypothetical protein